MRFVQGLVILSLIFIACPQQKMEGNWQDDNRYSSELYLQVIQFHVTRCSNVSNSGIFRLDISTECNIHNECSASMKYSPVCNVDHKLYFYSLCHAGCSSKSNIKNTKVGHPEIIFAILWSEGPMAPGRFPMITVDNCIGGQTLPPRLLPHAPTNRPLPFLPGCFWFPPSFTTTNHSKGA